MKLESILGASYGLHVNTSTFSLRNSNNCSFFWEDSLALTWKHFSESSAIITLSKSSHFALSAGPFKGNAGAFNRYNPLSVVA